MKRLFKIMILIVLNFSLSGCDNSIKLPPKHVYILDTHQMRPANINWADTTLDSPIPIAIYLSGYHNTPSQAVPWADVYICTIGKRNDTVRAHRDTIIVLDTNCIKRFDHARPTDFEMYVKNQTTLKHCKVTLTEEIYKRIGQYKYKFGQVELVTDD